MKEYEQMKSLAKNLGYSDFTALQEKAFSAQETYDLSKWLFVIGETSSGKTLIPLLLYFSEYITRKENGKDCKLLFAVPYRALAGQKSREISELAEKLELHLKIILSTGEFRNDDMDVLNGNTDVAVIIYEKVFMFSSMKSSFLDRYNMLVMDEIGLIEDISRGIKADFILLQAAHASLRVIALGTPFYDWSRYILAGHFSYIQENERPILLKTYPIYYTKAGVNYAAPECQAIQTYSFQAMHNQGIEINPTRRTDNMIVDICRYHLGKGHKILIFENNRTEVRMLSQRLYKALSEKGVIEMKKSAAVCKQYVLKEMDVSNDDELYGIMDDNDYRAFSGGIGYHNADVPSAFRLLIEREFLEYDGCLRILCSTETLVYGINSNADVVIIPSMIKTRTEESHGSSFLYPNEYMNYAGRAGRLNPLLPVCQQKRVGYVYPFLKGNYLTPDEERAHPEKDQKLLWDHLQEAIQKPIVVSSRYFSADPQSLPFYLLSIFSHELHRALTGREVLQYIEMLPRQSDDRADDAKQTEIFLDMLLQRGLICIENDIEDEDEEYEPEYSLTDTGKKLSGYSISISDYDQLNRMVCKCITDNNLYKADLLLGVLGSSEIRAYITKDISPLNDYYPQTLERAVKAMKNMMDSLEQGIFSKKQYQSIRNDIKKYTDWVKMRQYKQLAGYKRFQRQRFLFALLLWGNENCTIKQFYNAFALNYTQMKRFSEQISYRLDIVRLALPSIKTEDGELLHKRLGQERIQEAEVWLKEQSDGLFYRIPAFIGRFLNIQCGDPREAQKMRTVAKVYTQLKQFQRETGPLNIKERRQLEEIKKQIDSWKPEEWKNAFYAKFGEVLYDSEL